MSYLTKIASTILDWDCRNPGSRIIFFAAARELLILAEAQAVIAAQRMVRSASPVANNSLRVQEFVDKLQRTERDLDEILKNIESIQNGTVDVAVSYPQVNQSESANQELVSIACVKLASLASVADEIGERDFADVLDGFLSTVLSD